MDRTKSGMTNFHPNFAAKHYAPRFTSSAKMNLDIIIDKASIELFADNGLTVMTELFFSTKPYTTIEIRAYDKKTKIKSLQFNRLKSVF
jgi:fructan beta-fructosidase